ncbi:MAG TPA: NADH-quinone oxidoreductase subunit NuoG [Anaerolineales bacterium]|nr:NADH-quinone oxidoreductase subunit NuoG [Anaerolineales bacterium]
MSQAKVHLTIDGHPVDVDPGTLIVDAAKRVGINIPVFCYHPKLEPVGMCRMCLVEIGRPTRDRATGELVKDAEGRPVLQYGPKLETACTTPVGEGWDVRTHSEKAMAGHKEVVEFLLTSHPLDCPVCDKGGECPLQNLTMGHGPGKSRFVFDEKQRLAKRVPLGELIVLDRERCIQCGRCIRFQEEIADDPVIGFYERGRRLEIVTFSEPGFDSIFSGNTTDICPVGALTTTDFRFGARPWEMNAAASICPHCPVGCNLTLNTRREASSGGREVIKRVMPRQNEAVNEIWICDKGRFAHHFATSDQRLTTPLVRRGGRLEEATWEEAVQAAAAGLKAAGQGLVAIVGARAANEDLYAARRLVESLGGRACLDRSLGGLDLVQAVGAGSGTRLADLGQGDAVLVVASDVHQEAPIWFLQLRQAARRGARLIVANARPTRLEKDASTVLRYEYGREVQTVLGLLHGATGAKDLARYAGTEALALAGKSLAEARNLLVFYGGEGLDFAGSTALASACASLVKATGHVGKVNNGLVAVSGTGNSQGAWDMGVRPHPEGLAKALEAAKAMYVVASDPAGEGAALAEAIDEADFVVVQELFRTATAERANVVFPAQSFVEREGTYTNGLRRIQRFYPAVPPLGEARADWSIAVAIAERLGLNLDMVSASEVMEAIRKEIPGYAEASYPALARVEPQWPEVGGADLYFGGTSYDNRQGLGVCAPAGAETGQAVEIAWTEPAEPKSSERLLLVPVERLLDRGTTVVPSDVLRHRLAGPRLEMAAADAARLGIGDGQKVNIRWDGRSEQLETAIIAGVPAGSVLVPRSTGLELIDPVRVEIRPVGGQGE